jgi:hypothetical protein
VASGGMLERSRGGRTGGARSGWKQLAIVAAGAGSKWNERGAERGTKPVKNSILHVVRTQVNLWPKAQMLPGEDNPLCPLGAVIKNSDLFVNDGHAFLIKYIYFPPYDGTIGCYERLYI